MKPYVLDNAAAFEYERLDLMSKILDPWTWGYLTTLGVGEGWRLQGDRDHRYQQHVLGGCGVLGSGRLSASRGGTRRSRCRIARERQRGCQS